MTMSPVQKLFLACKHVFANAATGVVPSSQHIEILRSVLGKVFPTWFSFLVEKLD
ncbi:2-aminoethanethiol dioxygenase-like protein [Trifolium pratense]|uniref:2-aminoethanethiol dioxygenase-like protein n=1 Tax=Trifolium pratense TaxID=57577 RepID=A0A2K3L068_TRIPR|nr:2-aminoethanethiol dioxygenase-like protein [Trifolium pratense]